MRQTISLPGVLLLAAIGPLFWPAAARSQESPAGGTTNAFQVAAFDSVVVGEFEDRATENARFSGDTPEAIEEARRAYAADLSIVRENFSSLLLQELQRTGVFSEVVPARLLPPRRALLVDGEITQFDRGNLTTRFLIGMGAGRVRFDATVRIKDAESGTEIGVVDVNRGSGILGGAMGMAVTIESLMQQTAIRVAADLRSKKCAAMVCAEPPGLTIAADEDADRAAREFAAREDGCPVYFYVSLPARRVDRRGVEVWSDDTFVGILDVEDGYFFWLLERGDHQVSARFLSRSLQRSIQVHCAGQHAVFVHHEVRSAMVEQLTLEPENDARRDVRRRHLVLPQPVD